MSKNVNHLFCLTSFSISWLFSLQDMSTPTNSSLYLRLLSLPWTSATHCNFHSNVQFFYFYFYFFFCDLNINAFFSFFFFFFGKGPPRQLHHLCCRQRVFGHSQSLLSLSQHQRHYFDLKFDICWPRLSFLAVSSFFYAEKLPHNSGF